VSVGTTGTTLRNYHFMISATGGETPAIQEGIYKNNSMFNNVVYTQWYKYIIAARKTSSTTQLHCTVHYLNYSQLLDITGPIMLTKHQQYDMI
jgi:hypothetical protein